MLTTHRVVFDDDSTRAEVGWVCVRDERRDVPGLRCIDLTLFLRIADQERLKRSNLEHEL